MWISHTNLIYICVCLSALLRDGMERARVRVCVVCVREGGSGVCD